MRESEARTEIVIAPPTAAVDAAAIAGTAAQADFYARRSRAESTLRNYRKQWRLFERWCADRRFACLPAVPETIALYATDLANRQRPGSIQVALSAIGKAHRVAGVENPPTKDERVVIVMEGIRRTKGTAKRQVAPALKDDIRDMVKALPIEDPKRATRLRAIRDRAMILIGFGAALRSQELVALDIGDLAEAPDRGLVVSVRRSKTDQTGEGRMVAIAAGRTPATDSVAAFGAWLEESKIEAGAIFRNVDRHGRVLERLTTRAVALLIKERVAAAGIDPGKYSSHSLRAGLATSAALAGATELQITQQTGHKSTAMVKQYVRVADIWRDNLTEKIGL